MICWLCEHFVLTVRHAQQQSFREPEKTKPIRQVHACAQLYRIGHVHACWLLLRACRLDPCISIRTPPNPFQDPVARAA